MSTAYYAYIKMKPSQKEALIKAIADDKLLEFEHLIDENVESSIPVGHRAGGWRFSWSPYNKYLNSLDVKGIKEFDLIKEELKLIESMIILYDD